MQVLFCKRWGAALCFALFVMTVQAQPSPDKRLVSLGGSVTEIVYALGQGHLLVGNDSSSIYPSLAQKLPRVGYYRNLPLEGLLSLRPDLILASEQSGPESTLQRLAALDVSLQVVSDQPTLASLFTRIEQIAKALNVEEEGRQLEAQVRSDIEAAMTQVEPAPAHRMRALFLMNHSHHQMAAGSNTTPALLMKLAGMDNLLPQQQGYKPISIEALAALQPELIITTQASIQAVGGLNEFEQSTGVNLTPAGQQARVLVLDDLLILGPGPRTGQVLHQLIAARTKGYSP